MLTHLIIRNFAIIEHLEIPFKEGFTVLTGETGAGKSIIIDALNLLLGGRALTEVIRTSEEEANVEGVFLPGEPQRARINAMLEARGIHPIEDQLVIRRIVSRSGRNKVFVNGSLTTVSALGELTAGLVDISGQHEHYSLLDPDRHVDILDDFAELEELRQRVAGSFERVAQLRSELSQLRRGVRDRVNRLDYLRFQLDEIEAAGVVPGEDEAIEEELGRLRYAEKIQDAGRRALGLMYEADSSAAQQLSEAAGILRRVLSYDPRVGEMSERVEEVHILVEELTRELRSAVLQVESDPRRLDVLIARSEALKKLKRKHGETISEIVAHAARMREELERLEGAEERSDHLVVALATAELDTFKLSRRLSRARREAARLLEQCVESELADLNMARTRFIVSFEPAELPDEESFTAQLSTEESASHDELMLGSKGFDRVELLISPNVGEDPKPLAKIASGGELSRVMLVVKAALMGRDTVDTYIFDEVDTGIGGSTADMVGVKIQKTSLEHQVLCITHLPQIASRCDQHYLVEKQLIKGRTQSVIRPLSEEERVAEVARMLGGARVTSTTIEAARELITTRARAIA